MKPSLSLVTLGIRNLERNKNSQIVAIDGRAGPVHYSGIVGGGFKSLEEGTKVSYEATQGKKGMQAENVTTPV